MAEALVGCVLSLDFLGMKDSTCTSDRSSGAQQHTGGTLFPAYLLQLPHLGLNSGNTEDS